MADKRIIIIGRRVPTLTDPMVANILNGETFIVEDTLEEYYKHHTTGEIIRTGGGASGSSSASVATSVTYDEATKTYVLGFTQNRDPKLEAYGTTIRFVTTVDQAADDILKVKIGTTTYEVRSMDNQQLAKGSVKAGMLIEAVYDGTNFRTASAGGFSDNGDFDLNTSGSINKERLLSIPPMGMDGWIAAAELINITSESKGAIRLTSSDNDGSGGGSAIINYYHGTNNDTGTIELVGSATILSGTPFSDIQLQKVNSETYVVWLKATQGTSFEEYASLSVGTVLPYSSANTAVATLPVGNYSSPSISFTQSSDTSKNLKVSVGELGVSEISIPSTTTIIPKRLQVFMNGLSLEGEGIDYLYDEINRKIIFTEIVKAGNEIKVVP